MSSPAQSEEVLVVTDVPRVEHDHRHIHRVVYDLEMGTDSWDHFKPSHRLTEDLLLEPPPIEEQLEASWAMVRGQEDGKIPRMSPADLKKFVMGVLDGEIFTSRHIRHREREICPKCAKPTCDCKVQKTLQSVPEIDYGTVFMPIALGALKTYAHSDLEQIGGLYAYYDTAMGAVNGYPCFSELRVMHTLDWGKAWRVLDREYERRNSLDLELNELQEESSK